MVSAEWMLKGLGLLGDSSCLSGDAGPIVGVLSVVATINSAAPMKRKGLTPDPFPGYYEDPVALRVCRIDADAYKDIDISLPESAVVMEVEVPGAVTVAVSLTAHRDFMLPIGGKSSTDCRPDPLVNDQVEASLHWRDRLHFQTATPESLLYTPYWR